MKARSCLYFSKKYDSSEDKEMKAYCWMKPNKRRTLNVCRNCLLATSIRYGDKRTIQTEKPRWAE